MQCVNPVKIVKDIVNHAGIVTGVQILEVPCGRCVSCRLNYANSWSTRIVCEAKQWQYSSFVTLTYDDDHLRFGEKGNPTLDKKDCQDFFKRVRKDLKMRYFLGGEYGSLGRPHYHFCCFSNDSRIVDLSFWEKHWKFGFVYVGTLSRNSANYVAKYCVKKLGGKASEIYNLKGILPEFALMSRRPGIGYDYITKFKEMVKNNGFVVVDGKKQSIPKYFGARIFDDDEKNQRFLENSVKKIDELYSDVESGKFANIYDRMDFIVQENKQRKTNILSRMKRTKL